MTVNPSRIKSNIDLKKHGYQVGELMIPWSDNTTPLGYHPIPFINIRSGKGKSLLVIGGNHGDEFEGPAAILRISQKIILNEVNGHILLIPSLSFAAIKNSSRTNPLDDRNMNRAFPGNPNGSPTEMLAHYLETHLIPQFDAVIDLHSGGKASIFTPCSLATESSDTRLFQKNLKLAKVFGVPTIWILGQNNDNRSLNSAAERSSVPMIAAELGGGGGIDPNMTKMAELGILNILKHLNILKNSPHPVETKFDIIEISNPNATIHAPSFGLFDRFIKAGDIVSKGQPAGWFHYISEPDRASIELKFTHSGKILAHSNRGVVNKGEMLALVANDYKAKK